MSVGNADKVLPRVEIQFGNPVETHVLVYTLRSLMEVHKQTGKNPLMGELFQSLAPADVATLVWAGILHEKLPDSIEEIADRIPVNELAAISNKIREAFGMAKPAPEEEKKTED